MNEQKCRDTLKSNYQKNVADGLSTKDAVYSAIKEGILLDQLGDEIAENQIALWLEVSRTPVREAMHQLSIESLLEISHGRKAKIHRFSKKDAADISLLLRSLHTLAAELFIDNGKNADLQKLEEAIALASFYESRNDIHKMAQCFTAFHANTALACGNKWLSDIITRLLSYTSAHREYALSQPGRASISLKEHTAILDAIRERDKATTCALLSKHVDSAFDCIARGDFKNGV